MLTKHKSHLPDAFLQQTYTEIPLQVRSYARSQEEASGWENGNNTDVVILFSRLGVGRLWPTPVLHGQ
jgi:hypothetical protein